MSLLLIDQGQFQKVTFRQFPLHLQTINQQPLSLFTKRIVKSQHKNSLFLSQSYKETPGFSQWSFILPSLTAKFKNSLKIKVDKNRGTINLTLYILNTLESYLKIDNKQTIVEESLKLNRFAASKKWQMIKVAFNMSSRLIFVELPVFFGLKSQARNEKGHLNIQFLCTNYVQPHLPLLQFITNSNAPTNYVNRVNSLPNTYKYLEMAHINIHINSILSEGMDEQRYIKKEQIANMVKNRVRISQFEGVNSLFYCNPPFSFTQADYILSKAEWRIIENQIKMPDLPNPKLLYDNNFNLNNIYVRDLHNIKLDKINHGGFSTIYLSQIKYTCISGTQITNQQLLCQKSILKKMVIIKAQEKKQCFSRNRHELEILQMIKNGCSPFVPKYYSFANKPNPYINSVVMDYIPFPHLKEYLQLHEISVSLESKVLIFMSVTQGLRFIRDHGIVHLDLKPNNIMISQKLIAKLIDFGESYHSEVCMKDYNPGFTIPYSSPEIFTNVNTFTSKSDVFSLGVIMFQALFDTLPFDVFQNTDFIYDFMKSHLEKWFLVTEQRQSYGDIVVMRILNTLISKCLSTNPSSRPELDWMAIMLRHCLQFLN